MCDMRGPARSDTNTLLLMEEGGDTRNPARRETLHPALSSLCPRPPLQCLCTIAETGLVSVTPHSVLPFSRPGFHLSSQNYQYLSCYIFYYLFTVNSLFRSLIAECETSQSCSKYPETEGKVRERKEHTHKGNKEHANPLSSAWAKHLT